jgi:hypothetical protein
MADQLLVGTSSQATTAAVTGTNSALFGVVLGATAIGSADAVLGSSAHGNGVHGKTGGPALGISPDTSPSGVFGESTSSGNGVFGQSAGGTGVFGRSSTTGGVGVYGMGGQYAGKFDGAVQVNGNVTANRTLAVTVSSGQAITAVGSDPNSDCINATTSSQQHAGVSANNTSTGVGLWALCNNGVAIYGQSSNVAAQLNGQVNVNGNCHVTGTHTVDADIVLTNSDCAEDFEVDSSADIGPGTVLVLDEVGVLEPSKLAYDRRVAGVVSGAGEFKPGIVLGRKPGGGQTAPIALVGKTYCKVDADYGLVSVGDLLTTSPTLGHAMKAIEPDKAFGSVIGKALASLRSGRGLIPILVALQ